MISKISKNIANFLVENNSIDRKEFELYHYGLFVLISDGFTLLCCVVVGALYDIVLPGLCFFVSYYVIHKFAGGFHAKTELCCQIITGSVLFFCITALKFSYFIELQIVVVISLVMSIILIIFSPADTPQKPLTLSDKKFFKKLLLLVIFIGNLFVIIFAYKKVELYSSAICIAIVSQTISVVLGRLLNKRLRT